MEDDEQESKITKGDYGETTEFERRKVTEVSGKNWWRTETGLAGREEVRRRTQRDRTNLRGNYASQEGKSSLCGDDIN